MRVRPVWLDAGDAVELGELLDFLSRWLADEEGLGASFVRFDGRAGYSLDEFRADVSRFAFLLGGNDGEAMFGEVDR